MVTSNQQPDKKVVKMAEQNNSVVVPQRTLLGEVNEHITCPLCRGYYIDATTIVECLHSFCRSCIIKHLQAKSYCPVCEMMINSAKPNIKLDKALQDIVYKLVPGLFQKEMERRQQFYASRPGPAASATPEQRGEDTERIIFSPEDVISFSLEYCDVTDTDSISSKSSDSNESQPASTTSRRYLQCPAVVNISHLKKFLSMKFDIDSTQFAIDILYKRVPLPDYYTLMDIAYIYNWKRNEPMRFFYQIIDYVAIRNRLFDINRKTLCPFGERKSSPAPTEDTNTSSPAPHLNEQGSEASSGTDSPMLDERQLSHTTLKRNEQVGEVNKEQNEHIFTNQPSMSPKKNDDEVEKSQFLNSFELTAKSNCLSLKTSPLKTQQAELNAETSVKIQHNLPRVEEKFGEPSKRKYQAAPHTPELKKLRVEIEKTKISNMAVNTPSNTSTLPSNISNKIENSVKSKESEESLKKSPTHLANSNLPLSSEPTKEDKQTATTSRPLESIGVKRTVSGSSNILSPKRKAPNEINNTMQPPTAPRTVSPLKLPLPKSENPISSVKTSEVQKSFPGMKKMPDLKPGVPMAQSSQNKVPPVKVRMDLLANNSDFTKPKTSLSSSTSSQSSGDSLKSLFDSCKINIPSSLSITLTDQKQEARISAETLPADPKKSLVNKNLATVSNTAQHKVPSPPVHNYIEILKLPDTDTKKQNKPEGNNELKSNQSNKPDASGSASAQVKPPTKSSEGTAKGPIPNLKPIADTKLAKQSGNFSAPITFQQTFEQQLQSMQCDKKTKGPKNKSQVPKLVPATPKSFNAANKPTVPVNKPSTSSMPLLENKPSAALDLSTPHNIQNQLLTMQSIDNLAKKQNLPSKGISLPQSNVFPSSHRPLPSGVSPLRVPSATNMNLMKSDKVSPSASPLNSRHDISSNKSHPMKSATNISPSILSPGYQVPPHTSPSTAQPSPRSQTRSPSSSPKLVIAEEKQAHSSTPDQHINQSSQITSTQIPNLTSQINEHPKIGPGPSKVLSKPMIPPGKMSGVRQPLPTNLKPSPSVPTSAEYIMSQSRPQIMAHNQNMMQLRHQMEMNAWAQRHIDIYKNMAHQIQNEFNNKDKQ